MIGELGRTHETTRRFSFIYMLNKLLDFVFFYDKSEASKRIRCLAKRSLVRPLYGPLYPMCTALGESPK